ncbi:MAG: polysaccharide biosynthesis tyrosine autokinase [Chloroflexota bacterium]
MDLVIYFDIIRRRKWVIILTTLATLIVTIAGSLVIAPVYAAQSQLQVSTARRGSASYGDVLQAERMMKTYIELATSDAVVEEIARVLNLDKKPNVQAEMVANTELIELTVKHNDPVVAASVANTVVELLVTQSQRLREFRAFPISVIIPATIPQESAELDWSLTLALGMLAGLMGGVGLAFVLENVDTTLHSPTQIEALVNLKTLGELPFNRAEQPIVFTNGVSSLSEAYRTLRTNLQRYEPLQNIQTLMVTSAQGGEGKTTTSVNLAIAMAQAGQKVVLVDCDLRNPAIHQILNMPNRIGLSNALIEEIPAHDVLKQSIRYEMKVITSGPIIRSPVELIGSSKMKNFLNQLKDLFDFVILDVPAVLNVADALTIAPAVDGVALVVGANMVNATALTTAQRRLNAVQANLIGLVINRSEEKYIQG